MSKPKLSLVVNPYEWHRAPTEETPCPVCGSGIAGRRVHRRMRSDRHWIVRGAPQQVVHSPGGTTTDVPSSDHL